MQNALEGRQAGALARYLGAVFGVAALGGLFTMQGTPVWYRTLRKPRWTPPSGLFGPVWTILYIQMAVASWLVRRGIARHPDQAGAGEQALRLWIGQLTLNLAWSAVFFGRRSIPGGLMVIVPLWVTIAVTAVQSARVTGLAGALLLPYLAWTSFATALNFRIWQLNRGR
jgi:tryptophan-rich sensory protein